MAACPFSGVIDPSAPISIRSQPVGGVLGGVANHSTVMTLGVTADDPRLSRPHDVLPVALTMQGDANIH